MITPTDIVNRAIEMIGGNQPPVTGTYPNFDTSPAGVAAASLYPQAIATVGKRFGWDFARNIAVLVLSGNPAPYPWDFEYLYPLSGIEIRQLVPPDTADPNNPLPVSWIVGNTLVSSVPAKVIWSNLADASAAISNQPPVGIWDAGFTEAMTRWLASELAMALEGRPETARDLLNSSEAVEEIMETRNG